MDSEGVSSTINPQNSAMVWMWGEGHGGIKDDRIRLA